MQLIGLKSMKLPTQAAMLLGKWFTQLDLVRQAEQRHLITEISLELNIDLKIM